jgi:glyoxylase-like metal-dependent hydrolase (beta-lactamase superfamily II)
VSKGEQRGHVEPGGRPLIERLSSTATMIKLSVGPMDNNAYLIFNSSGAVLIDAANDADKITAMIAGRPVEAIITTHRHHDHLQALADVAEVTGARLVAGAPDAEAVAADGWVSEVGGVWDSDEIALGDERLEVIGLVGHTPGSITLSYLGDQGVRHLFTGDSLFPGGPGKTRSSAAFTSLMDDLETKIFGRFGDDTVVHPGHGDDTTLGAERAHLQVWRARGW